MTACLVLPCAAVRAIARSTALISVSGAEHQPYVQIRHLRRLKLDSSSFFCREVFCPGCRSVILVTNSNPSLAVSHPAVASRERQCQTDGRNQVTQLRPRLERAPRNCALEKTPYNFGSVSGRFPGIMINDGTKSSGHSATVVSVLGLIDRGRVQIGDPR